MEDLLHAKKERENFIRSWLEDCKESF